MCIVRFAAVLLVVSVDGVDIAERGVAVQAQTQTQVEGKSWVFLVADLVGHRDRVADLGVWLRHASGGLQDLDGIARIGRRVSRTCE